MIDGGLIEPWHDSVVAATRTFDQGDLVKQPPLFYAAKPSLAVCAATQLMAEEVDGDEDVVIELDGPPFGVITTQGCDIEDSVRKPWVQVAPVYPLARYATDERWLAEIRRDSVPHLVLLDPPDTPGDWVADLRMELPIEKSWLAGRAPIPGFRDDEGRRRFARRLADRLDRPALSPAVHDAVVRPLRKWLDKRGTEMKTMMADVGIEFRLLSQPDHGDMACRLLVVARRGPVPDAIRDAIEGWWVKVSANEHPGVTLLGPRYGSTDEITMREFLASDLLDGRHLPESEVA